MSDDLSPDTILVVIHGEGDYDDYGEIVRGVFTDTEKADAVLHRSEKVLNKNGTVSWRKGDRRPKTLTLDGCCRIETYRINMVDNEALLEPQ